MNLALLSILTLAAAPVQDEAPSARVQFAKSTVKPGEKVKATLTLAFAPGLHGYQNPPSEDFQIPVTVKVVEKGFTLIKATYPAGVDFTMAGETKPARVYEGTITIPLELRAAAKAGTYNVAVRVDYQQCNENSCFPPGSVTTKAKLTVAKKGKA